MITKHDLKGKPKYPLSIGKSKPRGLSSFPSDHVGNHQLNNSRPFKTKSSDLSLKGLSLNKGKDNVAFTGGKVTVAKAVKKYAEEFGDVAAEHFKEKIHKAVAVEGSGLELKDGIPKFHHKSTGAKFLDSFIVYPFKKLPIDIANSVVKGLRKLKPFKNSKMLERMENSKVLKTRANRLKAKSRVASIERFFNMVEKGETDKAFAAGHSRMNPEVANYSSPVERTLTRVVTGMGTALFLANDAFNLSKVLNDDDALAKKEKKRRFKQETARIAITAAFMFATMKTFAKEINKSGTASALVTAGTVVVSEVLGRVIAGNPILPVGEDSAKKYAVKHGKAPRQQEVKRAKTSNTAFRALASKKHFGNKDAVETFGAFKGFEGNEQFGKDFKEPPKEGKLTTKNIMKVLGGLVLFGFAVEKGSGIKSVKKVLNAANDKYKGIIKKDFTISREEFNGITKKLEKEDFSKVADKYKEIVKDQKGKTLNLGKVNHKVAEPIVHKVLTFPFRYAFDVAMLPYKKVVKPLVKAIDKGLNPEKYNAPKTAKQLVKEAEAEAKKNKEMLRNSIQFLRKVEKTEGKGKKSFKAQVSKSILASLDNKTKSSYSNADMAVVAGTAARAASSGFLIADNYNMVMINSNGQDKELAAQKAKERTVQRASRIVYGAFLIKLFNGLFSPIYNKSLLGAQAVNVMNTGFVETFTRKSVGLPLGESNREEIVKIEKNNLEAKGIKGGYFRFMANLTGKKPLSERASIKAKKQAEAQKTA